MQIDNSELNLSIDDDGQSLDENQNYNKPTKSDYKTRKLDGRLKKYEMIIKNAEKINKVDESEYLFVGNGGLNNNVCYELLEDTFAKYGKLTDIIMQKKKSYSFIIYENKMSAKSAVEHLQATEILQNQTPILFYLFTVDKVPDMSLDTGYREIITQPDGLIYLENYINNEYAQKIVDYITKSKNDESVLNEGTELKKRRVKHYGYEFKYGTNDCDETNPLTDPENQMPNILNNLFDKLIEDNLIQIRPDQMTVNFYEPGQGIPPHTDNITEFDEYIISLSLKSSVQMEFRQNGTKKFYKLYLDTNSLLVLKGDSRYNWSHLITERKHDLIQNSENNILTVKKREKRISLTFRKVKTGQTAENLVTKMKKESEIKLPTTSIEAKEFERAHVQEVYNEIADHFSSTRHSAWPGVAKFIESMIPYSSMIDVGCGNGKYLNLRKDLFCFGCDFSEQLIKICQERKFNCFVSDCLCVPIKTNHFDYLISIAVLHHLSTQERRVKSLIEMLRVLKPGGKGLVTVWAKEQKYKNKESFYISKKGASGMNKSDDNNNNNTIHFPKQKIKIPESSTNESSTDPNIHKFGKEFQKQDLFVEWNYSKNSKVSENKLTDHLKESEEKKVFLRFYHVFENKELENLFSQVQNARVIESFYEQGNWCAIFEKI